MNRVLLRACALVLSPLPAFAQTVTVPIDADGAGLVAGLDSPGSIDRDPDGGLWVPGTSSDNLFHVAADGTITEVFSLWPDLSHAAGVVVRADGTVFTSSQGTDAVLRVAPDGSVEPAVDKDGAGPGQPLDGPRELAVDAAGNVYVAGRLSSNVLRIAPDDSVVQIVGPAGAGAGAPLSDARDVAVDAAGVVYVAGLASDNVLAVTPGGAVSQVLGPAGDGVGHPLDGAAALAVAPDGTLYVASLFTHSVLRRTPGGALSAVLTSAGDGAGHALLFPVDLALAPDGTLYVAGLGSDNVFAVTPGGAVTQVASLTGDGAGHLLNDPSDMLVAEDGTLTVACAVSESIFSISGSTVTWLADVPGFGSGPASNGEGGLAFDLEGALLVGGWNNDEVVRLEPGGGTTLIVDDSGGPGAAFNNPRLVRVDDAGRAYVASTFGSVFRFDDLTGSFEIVIPDSGDGLGHALEDVNGMTFDGEGRLVVAGRQSDNLLRLEHDGTVVELLGPTGGGPGKGLNGPHDVVLGPGGTLYIANLSIHNVLALHPDGSVDVVVSNQLVHPGSSSNPGWYHLAVDPLGRVYLPGFFSGDLWRYDPDGTLTLLWEEGYGERPVSIAVDAGGAVYLGTEYNDDTVLRIEPSGETSVVVGPEGDGAGHPLSNPQDLNLTGPGRLDVSNLNGDSVMSVDLGFCGGWTLLPAALPADGSGPLLTGEGPLCAGSDWSMQISKGRPDTTATLFVGFSELSLPFKGGTLVPHPDLLLPLPLDAAGALTLQGSWPAGVPSGASVWLQAWIPEPMPAGTFRATNGLRIDLD